ncbi:Short chain dehydrogenase citE [Paramyrothecium foliicola]|nr:Short chain dehydrogenase citE [Paramyrothecium foliicola]
MDIKLPVKTLHHATYPGIAPDRPEVSTRGKSAVITGGGTGIGTAVAQSFARSGVSHLALLGRTEATLLETKAKVAAISPATNVHTYVVDVIDAAATTLAVGAFAAVIGGRGIDVLVANAGIVGETKAVVDLSADEFWRPIEVNVRGNFNLVRAFDAHATADATIIHVSTAAVHIPYLPGYSAYRSSKLAATRLLDNYAGDRPGLRVVHMHPGLVRTPGTAPLAAALDGVPGIAWDDAALAGDFAVWLASDEAAFLRGRFVWAGWDVEELMALRGELEADPSKLTIGLVV